MATFTIRRNHPYAGVVTLCKLAGGAFVPKEMVVTESAFLAEVLRYSKQIPPPERAKLVKAAPPATVAPPGAGEPKVFKVRKAATAAAS